MICDITTLVPLPVVHDWNVYKQMIPEQEIKDWWECKVANYLQNYARRNRLKIAQAKEIFFIEMHEKFVESVPQILKKLLDEKAERDKRTTVGGKTDSRR